MKDHMPDMFVRILNPKNDSINIFECGGVFYSLDSFLDLKQYYSIYGFGKIPPYCKSLVGYYSNTSCGNGPCDGVPFLFSSDTVRLKFEKKKYITLNKKIDTRDKLEFFSEIQKDSTTRAHLFQMNENEVYSFERKDFIEDRDGFTYAIIYDISDGKDRGDESD